MRVSNEDIIAVLAPFNPWWRGEAMADLPLRIPAPLLCWWLGVSEGLDEAAGA